MPAVLHPMSFEPENRIQLAVVMEGIKKDTKKSGPEYNLETKASSFELLNPEKWVPKNEIPARGRVMWQLEQLSKNLIEVFCASDFLLLRSWTT
ncbi:Hypothetical predicted protein [Lecanosticta acicola]|uniref:Uncharacterized protein n=1 Tax=Lecanosticta acicola TaxID=111012 RepID=A0AAI8Z9G9_9PEZI|nr:Hypothetical predicted protein [Lecanosticta acicola]